MVDNRIAARTPTPGRGTAKTDIVELYVIGILELSRIPTKERHVPHDVIPGPLAMGVDNAGSRDRIGYVFDVDVERAAAVRYLAVGDTQASVRRSSDYGRKSGCLVVVAWQRRARLLRLGALRCRPVPRLRVTHPSGQGDETGARRATGP